jgi:thioredoxin 1
MKKAVALLVLLVAVILISGCTENARENSANQNNHNNSTSRLHIENASVMEATRLKEINTYLQKNPVFLEIGSEGCSDCQDMKPILAQVAAEYRDRVTIMSVDMVKSPKLANYFGAYAVPVSFMLIGIKNGNYTYMQEDGNISSDILKSRIIGPRDKEALEKILDKALLERKSLWIERL